MSLDAWNFFGLRRKIKISGHRLRYLMMREGTFPTDGFKEIKVEGAQVAGSSSCGIEIAWDNGRLIRFSQVEQLVDFLKKVAWRDQF